VFSAAIDGAVYAKHGTNTDTHLTVFDKMPADDSASFASPGIAPDLPTLLAWVMQYVAATSASRRHCGCGGAGNCQRSDASNQARLSRPASTSDGASN